MSRETAQWLRTNVAVGFEPAWHQDETSPNFFKDGVPEHVAREILGRVKVAEGDLTTTIYGPDGMPIGVANDPTRKVIVRSDIEPMAVFGVFKQGYRPHDFTEFLADELARLANVQESSEGELAIGAVGLLKLGAVGWMTIQRPEALSIPSCGLKVYPWITAATSLDGSLATTYQDGMRLPVCDNTLAAAMTDTDVNRLKFKHTSKSLSDGNRAKIREALSLAAQVDQVGQVAKATLEGLAAQRISKAVFDKFVEALCKPDEPNPSKRVALKAQRKIDALQAMYEKDPRCRDWKGTKLGAVQTVNTWNLHNRDVRMAGFEAKAARAERNMIDMVTGATQKEDRQILALLDQIAG